jgi:hypothetical protein
MKIALAVILLVVTPLVAETPPEAPKADADPMTFLSPPPRPLKTPRAGLDRIDWSLLASDAGARALDTYSTRWALSRGNHEIFLPGFVANHTPALAALEGGMVTLDYFVARRLVRHGHPRLARTMLLGDALQVSPWAIHNLTLPALQNGKR